MKLLVVIPARNEAPCLPSVLDELAVERPGVSVLVVDDGSTDGTAELLRSRGVAHLRLALSLGVGGAVRAGLRRAAETGCTHVIRFDGDGQHPASAVDDLLAPLLGGQADAVCGARELPRAGAEGPLARRWARRGLASSISFLTGQRVSDPTSGLWAFGPRALALLARHHPTGYPEPELHLLLHRNRLRVVEVPVAMRPRLAGRSSLTPGRAALALARALLAMIVVPLRAVVAGASPT